MSARILLIIATLCAWGALAFVVLRFDPLTDTQWPPILFYSSAALALAGTFLNLGIALRLRQLKIMPSSLETKLIVRQATLLTLFILMLLYLGSAKLLRFWNIAPLAILLILVELFFHSLTRRPVV